MADLALACECGAVTGVLTGASPRSCTPLVCYCDDCQAFARALGRGEWLDAHGGTEVVQAALPQVRITGGRERLRSLRLSEGGLLRWHSDCCRTPIANTVSAKLPFAALMRGFVVDAEAERVLGPVRFRIFGRFARELPPELGVHPKVPLRLMARMVPRLLAAKLRGGPADVSFFRADGSPVAEPMPPPS